MSRNISLDVCKIIMVFMVICIHTNLSNLSPLNEYLLVNGIFRIAVPIFFLINGFYLYPVFIQKKSISWLKRLTKLYLVWMIIYSYFWFPYVDINYKTSMSSLIKLFVGYHHLWYISGLIGAVIILSYSQKLRDTFLLWSSLFLFLVGVLIQYSGNYHIFDGNILDRLFNLDWFHRNFLFLSYPFLCMGFLIHKNRWHEKITKYNLLSLSFLAFLLLLLESFLNFNPESRVTGFNNYFSLVFISPLIFMIFLNVRIHGNSKVISSYATAIYLVHPLLMFVIGHHNDIEGIRYTLSVMISSIFLAYLIVFFNKKIKFLI